jgi:hypothetical protein
MNAAFLACWGEHYIMAHTNASRLQFPDGWQVGSNSVTSASPVTHPQSSRERMRLPGTGILGASSARLNAELYRLRSRGDVSFLISEISGSSPFALRRKICRLSLTHTPSGNRIVSRFRCLGETPAPWSERRPCPTYGIARPRCQGL